MTESKSKKIAVALTAGAVLLLFILVAVLIYQLLSIKTERKNQKEYQEQIALYEQLIEQNGDTLEARKQRWWIERRARELGYQFPGDIDLNN